MIDFVEEYMSDSSCTHSDDIDEMSVLKYAVLKVMPIIMKNELTDKQSLCMRLFYVHGKNQTQIARELKLSQPTVSRHIKTAKDITNKCLSYCIYAVKQANEQWLKAQ